MTTKTRKKRLVKRKRSPRTHPDCNKKCEACRKSCDNPISPPGKNHNTPPGR